MSPALDHQGIFPTTAKCSEAQSLETFSIRVDEQALACVAAHARGSPGFAGRALALALWGWRGAFRYMSYIVYIPVLQKTKKFTTIIIFLIKTNLVNKGTVAQTGPQIDGDTLLGFSVF